eukprot:14786241-Ditylum_brightwellii.AAC.1
MRAHKMINNNTNNKRITMHKSSTQHCRTCIIEHPTKSPQSNPTKWIVSSNVSNHPLIMHCIPFIMPFKRVKM